MVVLGPPVGDGTDETLTIEGHFVCGPGLIVTSDCLGRIYRTRTVNRDLEIGLPELKLPTGGMPTNLAPPRWSSTEPDVSKAKRQTKYDWGMAWELPGKADDGGPETRALVLRWRFEMAVASSPDKNPHSARSQPMVEVEKWWELLSDWIGVLSAIDIAELIKKRRGINNEEVWTWVVSADGSRSFAAPRTSMPFHMADADPINHETLTRCMELAAAQAEPPDAWRLLRDARSLWNAREYRRAVIDAGTAAELAMTELLDRHLATSDPNMKKALYDKYQTLNMRAQLLTKLGAGTVPERMQQLLAEPRNDAAHDGGVPGHVAVASAIMVATQLVEQAYPLDQFMQQAPA